MKEIAFGIGDELEKCEIDPTKYRSKSFDQKQNYQPPEDDPPIKPILTKVSPSSASKSLKMNIDLLVMTPDLPKKGSP